MSTVRNLSNKKICKTFPNPCANIESTNHRSVHLSRINKKIRKKYLVWYKMLSKGEGRTSNSWIVKFNTFGFFPTDAESKPWNLRGAGCRHPLVKINPPIVSMVEINLKFAIRFWKNSGPEWKRIFMRRHASITRLTLSLNFSISSN